MEFPLNDLILEFSQFFDEKFIQEVRNNKILIFFFKFYKTKRFEIFLKSQNRNSDYNFYF